MSGFLSSADLALARRMEDAEAANAFRLIRGSQQLKPDCGWEAEEMLGGCAMFGGVGSPMTHLMGGGMSGPATAEDLDRLEEFFRSRGSPCLIDLCPLADPSLLDLIMRRGYHVVELNNLLAMAIPAEEPEVPATDIRAVLPHEHERFTRLICQGFSPSGEAEESLVDALGTLAPLSHSFVATADGQWAAGGSLGIEGGVALFYGDATLIPWRGRGLQTALIGARLRFAQGQGADLAMVTVLPGTSSHRNYERAGFRLVYMRVNLSRAWS